MRLQTATLKPGSQEKMSRIKEFWADEAKGPREEVGASAGLQDGHHASWPPGIRALSSRLPHGIGYAAGDKHNAATVTGCRIPGRVLKHVGASSLVSKLASSPGEPVHPCMEMPKRAQGEVHMERNQLTPKR